HRSLSLLYSPLFFFNYPPTSQIYTLSLHDALPISFVHDVERLCHLADQLADRHVGELVVHLPALDAVEVQDVVDEHRQALAFLRSEEHTSELQSRENLVCRLLLEKKKKSK